MRLRKEIGKLKRDILSLSAIVQENVRKAVQSVAERNEVLAREVIESDPEIDEREVDLEEECLKILALHQPVAIDLRYIIAVLKINNDLERIGDLAVNIAERGLSLSKQQRADIPFDLPEMAKKVQAMLGKSLDALVDMDTSLAYEVCLLDDEVDKLNREMFEQVHSAIRRDPDQAERYILLLSVSRHLERIADQATNICEDVVYMIEGKIIRHRGEEGDLP